MSAESPRHMRCGGPLTVPAQPPADRSIIDAVSGFINDVKLTSPTVDAKDVIQWARFETADINEPTSEGDSDTDISPLLLILGYGTGVQVWLIPPNGEAQEVLSWRQGTVRVLRILPTPDRGDCFTAKRPLIALCDSASPGPAFCSLSFISIRGGEQVKSIKFKNPILDVLANKRSVVVSFSERFAVFDAGTLEDRLSVTTCYPCPCPLGGTTSVNPLALGDRWLAYADKKLNPSKRSSGGCESEGQTSYTATVLHAAKSLSKGLRGLGESVAQSLSGTRGTSQSPSPPHSDLMQPGVVTVLDIEGIEEEDGQDAEEPCEPTVAHFIAHSEPVTALKFDASGLILVTADRRGHDFHVFRLNPHPCGPSLASAHHLYVLHRGDTTAKVQDISISVDCRWLAVSTLRGTTHIFAIAPYGGAAGVRTHTQPRVVNRLSRFHRSAGLPIHAPAKPASPVGDAGQWFPNPRLPPYPAPVLCSPLAQLRPTANLATHTITRTSAGRQRLSSLSEESPSSGPLLARAAWGRAGAARGGGALALYLMTASGSLLHLLLHPRPANNVPKEKISDDSPIEVEVEALAQWPLQRPPAATDLLAPLPPNNPLLHLPPCRRFTDMCTSSEERWLAQVEIVTHAGPHRRLWMGPQFVFKTYNCTGSNSSLSEAEAVEVESVARSNPVNMPAAVPILVDSGSASSLEQSPSDSFRRKSLLSEPRAASVCDVRLREDLAEAMKEDHGSRREEAGPMTQHNTMELAVDPLGTVVRTHTADPVPRLDPDDYTRANTDEATFRPVLNAPASLPPASLPAKPLPLTTTIPVQSLTDDFTIYSTSINDYDHVEQPVVIQCQEPIPAKRKGKDDRARDSTPEKKEITKDLDLKVGETKMWEPASKEKSAELVVKKIPEETVPKMEIEEVKVVKEKKSDSKSTKSKSESKSAKKEPELKKDITEPNKDVSANKVVADTKKESPEIKKVTKKEETPINKKEVSEPKKDVTVVAKKETAESKKSTSGKKEVVELKRSGSEKLEPLASKKEQVEVKKEVPEQKNITETKKEMSQKEVFKSEVEIKTSIEKEISIKTSKKAERKKSAEKELSDSKQSEKKEDEKISAKKEDEKISAKKETTTKSVKEPTPEPRLVTKSNPERDSSPRKDLTELKSSWKRDTKLEWSTKSETNEKSSSKKEPEVAKIQIKAEEQAWDMLLSEPEKPVLSVSPQSSVSDESKKSKKNRKIKKSDETQKSEDDSFVEIHAIEDKIQSSGELVSISMPFEEIESTSSKIKKSTSKSTEKKEQTKLDDWSLDIECAIQTTKRKSIPSDIEVVLEYDTKAKHKESKDCYRIETEVMDTKDYSRTKTSNQESRKSTELDVKDVYVIDSTKEEFPEIQITSGRGKIRKKSHQVEKSEEIEVIPEKPIKSWSSIAASKNKKEEPKAKADRNVEKELDYKDTSDFKVIKSERSDKTDVKKADSDVKVGKAERKQNISKYEDDEPPLSLHEELMRLCKRTDIMVAECDAPSELNFVDEHLLHDLPPLDLDFGMDDFNLEVMRDSLLEHDNKISSPICKIDIDSILSSIKESTSAFNLIDLEKVPDKKEKGFSVVENDKITSSEVKADDDSSPKSDEAMEKSSDDDNASPASADSDKEDKKSTGASNITLPSTKQSKAKKSRRKKK